ncbi:MAG: hypothetical protein RLZZ450_6469 [Pseudomonadota bacterium]
MRWLWPNCLLACLLACSGQVDPSLPSPASDGTGGSSDSPSGGGNKPGGTTSPGSTPAACADSLLSERAVLVTPRQYVNTLRDLLGQAAVSEADSDADAKLEFETVDRPQVTTATLDRVLRLAESATASVRGKTADVLGCKQLDQPACVRTGLGTFGRRAFKRPLEAAELDALLDVYTQAKKLGEADEGAASLALQAVLVAPSTLYRTEFRSPDTGKVRGLTQHERAASIASLLLDSLPDPELLVAADKGELATKAGLEAQINRLLALPRVREHVTRLVLTAFNVPRVFETVKDGTAFPEFGPALQSSMYEESRRFVDDVLWTKSRPLSALLTSRNTFVDPTLAKLYGVTYPGKEREFAAVELGPERSGLLTQASVLTVLSRTEKTSVVARGLFVRGAMLCLPKISSPPASVQAQINAQLADSASERELAAYRAQTSPCKSCHAQFDRLGLLLEGFDALGRRNKANERPVDLTGLGMFEGEVLSPSALAMQAADEGDFARCLSERVYAYALTTASEPGEQDCVADKLEAALEAEDGSLRALLSALVQQPDFFRRANEEI